MDQPLKAMRIIARLNVGGPALHCLTLSDKLNDYGIKTTLVTGNVGRGEEQYEKLFDVPTDTFKLVNLKKMGRFVKLTGDLRSFFELVSIMRKERPDIVHTHTAKAGVLGRVAAWVTGVPVVVHTFHGHVLRGYFSNLVSYGIRVVEQILARKTNTLITLSPQLKKELSHEFKIAPENRFAVVPLGRNLNTFYQSKSNAGALRKELSLSDQTFLIGTVGRLVPIKNQQLLIRAYAEFLKATNADSRLIIVGDGPERDSLEQLAKDLNVERQVIFLGWRKDLDVIYRDLNLFTLSSINEGTPLSIIESFASSCPVLTTKVGGIADLFVADSTQNESFEVQQQGVLVENHDLEGYSKAIEWIYSNPDILKQMKDRAFEQSHQYTDEQLSKNMAQLYRSLIEKSQWT